MNIVYITMQFPAPSETFASLDVNALIEENNSVQIYCLRPKHKKFKSLKSERHNEKNIDIYHLSIINFLIAIIYMIKNIFKVISLVKWVFTVNSNKKHIYKSLILLPSIFYIYRNIIKNKPDMIHLFWGHYPSMVLYLIKKYEPKIPFTMFLGAHDLEEKYGGSLFMSKYSKKIFTHSYENVKDLISFGIEERKIKVLHRGTVINKNVLNLEKREIISKEIVFLTGARLIKEKGVDDVIEIFYNFNLEYSYSKLYIAGEGEDLIRLKELVRKFSLIEKVEFLGHISQDKLFKYMNEAHFFLLMSKYHAERLPNVVKEAMLRQCICITTPTIGIKELITHNKDGFIYESINDVSNMLKTIINDDKQLDYISRNAQSKIIKYFNVNKTMQDYIKIWKEVKGSYGK